MEIDMSDFENKKKPNNLIVIPGDTFTRGSHESPDEEPVIKVTLDSYAIDKTPVTNQEYRKFIEKGGYDNPSFWTPQGWNYIKTNKIERPNYWFDKHWNQDNHPVTGVSWWEAKAYAKFTLITLRTE